MALTYTKTIWVDNSAPAINATNLNNIEAGVKAVTDQTNTNTSTIADLPTTYEAKDTTIAKTGAVNVFSVAQKEELGTVSYLANVALDMNAYNHFSIALTGNITLDNPINITASQIQSGVIQLTQDATGGRTLTLGTSWVLLGVDGTDTTANKINLYKYTVINPTTVLYEFIKAI